jgi:hypothetical protein
MSACVSVVVEMCGDHYVRNYRTALNGEVADDRRNTALYQRPGTAGALDQNAAVWYRLAFARTPQLAPEETRKLDSVVHSGMLDARSDLREWLENLCDESRSVRLKNALACTHCNWDLGYQTTQSAFDSFSQTATLADCLILQGYASERDGHVNVAISRFFDALSFGCDLGVGDFNMNIAGLIFARNALTALAQAVLSIEQDRPLLTEVSERLAKFQRSLPVEHHGLRLERLRLAEQLLYEAEGPVRRGPSLAYLTSPRSLVAWRLHKANAILQQLREALVERDSQRRLRLAREVDRLLLASTDATLSQGLPEHWLRSLTAAEEMLRLYRGVQAAVELQLWYTRYHRYPPSAEVTGLPLASYGLRYTASDQGDRYQLQTIENSEPPTIVLESRPPGALPNR